MYAQLLIGDALVTFIIYKHTCFRSKPHIIYTQICNKIVDIINHTGSRYCGYV